MFNRSLFIGTLAACAFLSGGIASADKFNISSDYSLTNSLGQLLDGGTAILGAFNSSTWSYSMETSKWSFEGTQKDQLTYSDLVSMQTSFTNALNQTGEVAQGSFNISGGTYQSPPSPESSPVCLMVTGENGETAIFVFRSVIEGNPVLNYSDVDIQGQNLFDLWLASKENALASELPYYAECILGNINPTNNTVQLLVPEPATATLGLLGLAALIVRRRRR